MQITKSRATILTIILIAVFVILAFLIRTILPFDKIFTDEGIKYSSIDAYYQVGIIDNWVHNFPSLTQLQPFLVFPGGQGYGSVHFFNFFIALIIWVLGLGSPSQQLIDVISVYYPAVLAALTVIPVYFIGKALINRWAGLLAAAFFAVMPGEYLGRSIIGFTDQHVMETLLTAMAGLFAILAIKTARERDLSLRSILNREWKVMTRPLVYSLLASLFLGLYLISWLGALLFVFIVVIYLIIQFIADHLAERQTEYLSISTFFIFFPVALVMYWPLAPNLSYVFPLIIAALIPPALGALSYLIRRRNWHPGFYPLGMVILAVIGVFLFRAVSPAAFNFAIDQLAIFNPSGSSAETTMEMQPFLSPSGSFSTQVAWGNFTTSFFLFPWWPIPGFGLIGLIVMIVVSVKERGKNSSLLFFAVWSAIILLLTLGQRRFAYYLVVNISLLSGYLVWQIIWWAGAKRFISQQPLPAAAAASTAAAPTASGTTKAVGNKPSTGTNTARSVSNTRMNPKKKRRAAASQPQRRKSSSGWNTNHVFVTAVVLIAMLVIFMPSLNKSIDVAAAAAYAPSDAWQESLEWLKNNTPEPLGDPDAIYNTYEAPYTYPDTAYAVTSWWDYGYWISRTAHRIPNANPSQDPKRIKPLAQLLLSTDESEWTPLLEQMKTGYMVIDNTMVTTKFWAIVNWAGLNLDDYISTYAVPQEGKLAWVSVYNPAYYETLLVRLYNLDAKAVSDTDAKPIVLEYIDKIDAASGSAYRQVTNIKETQSYQEAVDYIDSQESGNFVIVSANPLQSPVPVEALNGFDLVHQSPQKASVQASITTAEVKVFQHTGS